MDPAVAQLSAIVIFLFTFVLIITGGRSRTVSGLVGTFLMIAAGIFSSIEEILSYVHVETLVVLFGIMVLVGVLREGQFFSYVSAVLLRRVGLKPTRIFYAFIIMTAALSAFLDSVAVVLFIAVVTIELGEEIGFDPKPLVITEIIIANIAGTATAIGDPPNIIISLTYGISFSDFIINMGPITIVTLVVLILYIRRRYKSELKSMKVTMKRLPTRPAELIKNKRIFLVGTFMFLTFLILMVLSGSLGVSPALIGLGVAAALLFLGGNKLVPILEDVEWSTLLFFGSIFIVVGGLTKTGVIAAVATSLSHIIGNNLLLAIIIVTWFAAVSSAFIDNIPLVVTMLPLIQGIAATTSMPLLPLLWSLIVGSNIGGTATIIGTAAGVVASDVAEKRGHGIKYMEYLRVGVVSVLLTVGVGTVYLVLRYGLVPA